MITITTKKGVIIACDAVVPGAQYPVLNIHTHAMSGADAYTLFSDPEQTAELTETKTVEVVENEQTVTREEVKVYTGYTSLYSVGQSPFIPGDLLIWLNRTV